MIITGENEVKTRKLETAKTCIKHAAMHKTRVWYTLHVEGDTDMRMYTACCSASEYLKFMGLLASQTKFHGCALVMVDKSAKHDCTPYVWIVTP